MKSTTAILLLSLSALAAIPAADAHSIDPVFRCTTLWDFPDEGMKLCVEPSSTSCSVYLLHTTFTGTQKICLVAPPASSTAAAGPVECYDVYSRTDVGTVSVVRRDSCAPPEVYQCPREHAPISECQDLLTLEASSAAGPNCFPVYSRTNVGTISIVRRTSCSPPEVYQCPTEGAPLSECRNILEPRAASGSLDCYYIYTRNDVGPYSVVRRTSCSVPEVYECPYEGAPIEQCQRVPDLRAESSSEPMCMYYYYEFTVGPVRHVQRDSCHSENYVCGVLLDDYLAQEPDPLGLLHCTIDSLGLA